MAFNLSDIKPEYCPWKSRSLAVVGRIINSTSNRSTDGCPAGELSFLRRGWNGPGERDHSTSFGRKPADGRSNGIGVVRAAGWFADQHTHSTDRTRNSGDALWRSCATASVGSAAVAAIPG